MPVVRTAYRAIDAARAHQAHASAQAARSAAVEAIDDYTRDLFEGSGFEPMVARGTLAFDGSIYPNAFCADVGSTPRRDLPEGLRWDPKSRSLRPALRTEAGKSIASNLKRLAFQFPLVEGLGGIISGYQCENKPSPDQRYDFPHYNSAWTFHSFDMADGSTQVFATSSLSHIDDRYLEDVDPMVWEKAPLSAFYAALETHREQQSDAEPVPA